MERTATSWEIYFSTRLYAETVESITVPADAVPELEQAMLAGRNAMRITELHKGTSRPIVINLRNVLCAVPR